MKAGRSELACWIIFFGQPMIELFAKIMCVDVRAVFSTYYVYLLVN